MGTGASTMVLNPIEGLTPDQEKQGDDYFSFMEANLLNLLKAYDKANELANQQRIAHVEYHVWAGLISAEAGKALREPAIRHGIKANRKTLETAAQYSHEQGLTPRLMKLEELFAPSAMEQ